jgi:hypothetical protein
MNSSRTPPLNTALKFTNAQTENAWCALYKALAEGFTDAIDFLPQAPEEARKALIDLRQQFGWTSP